MTVEVVLFDLDGTLADSLPLIEHTYRLVFEEMGIPWGEDAVMGWIGRTIRDIAEYFAGRRAQEFIERYQMHYHREHDKYTALFPETLPMLAGLKQRGLRLGIVTSKGRTGAMRTVNFTGLAPYMDTVVTAHDVEKHKPLPDPVLEALRRLAAPPERAVYVGDSQFDIQAGRTAGTRTLGVTWGMAGRAGWREFRPDGVLERWDDLDKYL
ncbi:HAD-IA family hydrolase [Desulfotomaculum copahuensis]|uniref:Haloacid dehalogenase n=1 Tax=Desulfotomaculum copahuensis TaxID=1838280 RepID=A0A1B7LDR8_9FIRM|nr:HAD-IA family hydrolase [Desulfotomaculum copahuensis]OAT81256.1 haloacid dehalogenase [Desulfotomaculum copahuensis]